MDYLVVELPMPDGVTWNGSSSVAFNWKDPWRDTDIDIPAELINFLSLPPEKILPGRSLDNVQRVTVQPPGRYCKVEWGEVEPYDGTVISYQQNGVIALPSHSFDRQSRGVNLLLYPCGKVFLWGAGALPV